MIDKDLYDPFDEEDWDEKEHNYYYFKVWIGVRSREIRILCFKPHIRIEDQVYYIYDDKYRVMYKTGENTFHRHINQGIIHGNFIIVDSTNYDINKIYQFISFFLKERKNNAIERISKYKRIIDGDDDYDEDVDFDRIQFDYDQEKILLNNIENIFNDIVLKKEIKKLIDIYF